MRLFNVGFDISGEKWSVYAKDEDEAINRFIGEVKDVLGSMSHYGIKSWSEMVHVQEVIK